MGFLLRTIAFFTGKAKAIFSTAAEASSMANYPGGFMDKMTEREACLILDVEADDDPDYILERHRKLLLINHPDKNGSTFLCSKISEAKDLLLKHDIQ